MKIDLGHINRIVLVSVNIGTGGNSYSYFILRKKKGEIDFEKQGEEFDEIEKLIKETSTKYPFVLHFEGKGIISRKALVSDNYKRNLLLNNSSESDFYFTEFTHEETVYFSFIRRDTIDAVSDEFGEHGAKVIEISSGPFTAGIIAPFLDQKELEVCGFTLELDQKGIRDFSKSSKQRFSRITLGDDHFESCFIPAIGRGAVYFNSPENLSIPEPEDFYETNLAEAKQKNIFRRFSGAMLIFFALALTGNYFYLDHINGKIEENYVELSAYEGQLTKLNELKEEKQRKEALLQSSGLLSKSFLSFYLMELGNSVPHEISFDQIQVRPFLAEIKDRHKIEFMERLITLSGKSKTSHILQKWIEQLEEKDWIGSVEIMNYTYAKNRGNFELQILLN